MAYSWTGYQGRGDSMRGKLANWIFFNLSGNKDAHCVSPGSECWFEFGEVDLGHDRPFYTATTYNNDGFELWIAYTGGKWIAHFRAKAARQLAWFILWNWWAKSTWCGLKRRIWYWALSRRNKKHGIDVAEYSAKLDKEVWGL